MFFRNSIKIRKRFQFYLSKFINKPLLVFSILFIIAISIRYTALLTPNQMLIDEAYYVPASISIIEDGTDPNYVHPPFGKYMMALSILMLGDNSAGWRFFPVILGSLSVSILYLLGRKCYGTYVGIISALFLIIDPMAYTMSRLAMLDIFLMFFTIMGSLMLIEERYSISAIAFSLSCGIKFIGILPIMAAIIFLIYRKQSRQIWKLLMFPFIFMLLIYLPFIIRNSLSDWVENIFFVINWHITLTAEHPSISHPYGWLFNLNPFPVTNGENPIMISANPFLYPMVIPFSAYLIYAGYKEKLNYNQIYPVFWFILTYIPFFLLPRETQYIFYLLPSVPAILLIVSYGILQIFLKLLKE